MKITIISGSHRESSQSMKVAGHIQKTLLEKSLCDDAEIFSLTGNPLPLWDQGVVGRGNRAGKRSYSR